MGLNNHIQRLTDAIFKMLPMKEEQISGKEVFLQDYVETVKNETLGMMKVFPELRNNYEYVRVCSTLQEIDCTNMDLKMFRKEVLKMTSLLNKVQEAVNG